MKLQRAIDTAMTACADGLVSDQNYKKFIADKLIEEIKNMSPDEFADRIKEVKLVKHKREEGPYLEYVITLSEFYKVKPLD